MTWQPIDTMPTNRRVLIKTVTGIICPARTSGINGKLYIKPARSGLPRRVPCFRADKSGDVMAVAWREIALTRMQRPAL